MQLEHVHTRLHYYCYCHYCHDYCCYSYPSYPSSYHCIHMHMHMGHLVGRARVRPEEEQPVELRRDVDLGRLEMRAALLRTRRT